MGCRGCTRSTPLLDPSLIVVIVFELKVVFLESEEHFAHFRSHVLSDAGIGCPAGGRGERVSGGGFPGGRVFGKG